MHLRFKLVALWWEDRKPHVDVQYREASTLTYTFVLHYVQTCVLGLDLATRLRNSFPSVSKACHVRWPGRLSPTAASFISSFQLKSIMFFLFRILIWSPDPVKGWSAPDAFPFHGISRAVGGGGVCAWGHAPCCDGKRRLFRAAVLTSDVWQTSPSGGAQRRPQPRFSGPDRNSIRKFRKAVSLQKMWRWKRTFLLN